MALTKVEFEATPGAGVQAYWIRVDEQNVRLKNRKGVAELSSGEAHFLYWGFAGNAGSTLGIKVTKNSGHVTVVEVKESKMPAGEIRWGSSKRFELP